VIQFCILISPAGKRFRLLIHIYFNCSKTTINVVAVSAMLHNRFKISSNNQKALNLVSISPSSCEKNWSLACVSAPIDLGDNNLWTSAELRDAWQVTAMDITFMMQVQEMQKFFSTLTHDSSSIESATLRPYSASIARKVNKTKDIKAYAMISSIWNPKYWFIIWTASHNFPCVWPKERTKCLFLILLRDRTKESACFVFWLPFS
jgi:hypothetical protein